MLVSHLGQGNPRYEYNLGEELIESTPSVEKNLEVLLNEKHEPAVCSQKPERQQYSGLHQKRCGQQGEGGHCPSLTLLL